MWVVHYLLGGVFYLAMGIGVWIEGTGFSPSPPPRVLMPGLIGIDAIDGFDFSLGKVYALVGPPSAKSLVGVLLFIMGSGLQFDCHAYLASLEKYTLPVHPAFQRLVCPHYFAECLIYIGFTIMSAPRGRGPVNVTVMTALVFSAVNLGVTSLINREWYEGKFGKKAMQGEFLPLWLPCRPGACSADGRALASNREVEHGAFGVLVCGLGRLPIVVIPPPPPNP